MEKQRKAEDTVSSGRSRNVDILCRKLSLKIHLLLNLRAHRIKSQESKKCVLQPAAAASDTSQATKTYESLTIKQRDDEVPMR